MEDQRQSAKEKAVQIALQLNMALIRRDLEVHGMYADGSTEYISESADYELLWQEALVALEGIFEVRANGLSDTACPSVSDKIKRQLTRTGIDNPPQLPDKLIIAQFGWFVKELMKKYAYEEIAFMHKNSPFYVFDIDGRKIAISKGGFAPLAVQYLEEALALGVKQVILTGTCGSLEANPQSDLLYLVEDCIASDSISEYYQGSQDLSRLISPKNGLTDLLESFCKDYSLKYSRVRGWTVNALYLQTEELRKKATERKAKCVDGEVASIFSVANYRNVSCGALLFWSDIVGQTGDYKFRNITPESETYQYYNNVFEKMCRWFANS